MPNWPDRDGALINQFVKQLELVRYGAPYRAKSAECSQHGALRK